MEKFIVAVLSTAEYNFELPFDATAQDKDAARDRAFEVALCLPNRRVAIFKLHEVVALKAEFEVVQS